MLSVEGDDQVPLNERVHPILLGSIEYSKSDSLRREQLPYQDPLSHFQYDVFVSYGWAGLAAEAGDRRWVRDFCIVLGDELSGELGRKARIFLDESSLFGGSLTASLQEAIENSASFITVISPGSCHPESWCRKELDWFIRAAASEGSAANRMVAIQIRSVPLEHRHPFLKDIRTIDFLTAGPNSVPLPPPQQSNPTMVSYQRVQIFATGMRSLLENLQSKIAKSVFFARNAASNRSEYVERLSAEVIKRRGLALHAEVPCSSEAEFYRRVRAQLRESALAVHLIDGSCSPAPRDWSGSPWDLQLRASAERFNGQPDRVVIWAKSAGDLGQTKHAQNLAGTGFEYLASLIQDLQKMKPAAATGISDLFIFVDCLETDLKRVGVLKSTFLKHGLNVRTNFYGGEEVLRRKLESEMIQACLGAAVYFGSYNDVEAAVACQRIANQLGSDRFKAVMLDPQDEPIRNNFYFPSFKTYSAADVDLLINDLKGTGN